MSKVPNVTFKNGNTCPIVGLGTWKSEPGDIATLVKDAISCGYRHFDCSVIYMNEPEVGQGIAEKIADGTVTREELFVTTKLWTTLFRRELVVPAIKRSLKDLGLSYVDIYLMHWPCGLKEGPELFPIDSDGKAIASDGDYVDVWKGMEEVVERGLAKSIGISNFNKRQIERLLKTAKISPANNQIECHPYLSQKKLIKFCLDNEITVTAYSPLGSPDRPPYMKQPEETVLLEDPTVVELATKYNKNPGQILIKYHIQNGIIVIPKSANKTRIESNMQVFDFEISSTDMESLESLNRDFRYLSGSYFSIHKDFPFDDED